MKKTVIFVVNIEWTEDNRRYMTHQIARDKLIIPVQEMWIRRDIDKFSLEEIETADPVISLSRGNKKGLRQSFYKDPPKRKLK